MNVYINCDVRGTSCRKPYECNYNSCNICESCSYNYDCDARETTCSGVGYSCNYNSCGICTSCSYNPDCTVSSVSCNDKQICEYNSCGICYSCKDNPDCNVTPKTCSEGCKTTNSCGICTECNPVTPCHKVGCPWMQNSNCGYKCKNAGYRECGVSYGWKCTHYEVDGCVCEDAGDCYQC